MWNYNSNSTAPWNSYRSNIKNISIENGVTSIGNYAFYNCYSLTSITIPNSVTSFGIYAFFGCYRMTSITIPNSVTSIGNHAFYECYSLTSITIPNSVTSIGNYAFYRCYGMTSITIPNSVTSIGNYAFYRCYGMTSITIGNSVTSIGESAFDGCSGLTSFIIPKSVKSLGNRVLSGCSSLATILVDDNNITYDSRDNCNAIINKFNNSLIAGCKSTIIPNSVISIGKYAFSGANFLTTINIPRSVTSIGDYAFSDCDNLTSVNLYNPKPITIYSGSNPFPNPSKITLYVPLGSKDTYLSNYYWKYFKEIIEYPDDSNIITFADPTVKSICLANWDINGDNEISESEAAAVLSLGTAFKNSSISTFNELRYFIELTSISEGAFSGSSITQVTLPDNITSIGKSAFLTCKSLTDINIPSGVTSIEGGAFFSCTSLNSVTIPSSVTSIGHSAFFNCSNQTSISVALGNTRYDSRDNCNAIIETSSNTLIAGCKNTVIPNSVTSIGDFAFHGCSGLNSVTIPNKVTNIGIGVFSDCRSLSSISVATGNTRYDSRDNCNAIIETSSNTLISGCKKSVIPSSVTNIGYYAFNGCTGLTSVNIPNKVTSIGEGAFQSCTGLPSITIPNSVTSRGDIAFNCCFSLTSVTIPNSLKSIGNSAFTSCYRLTSITIPNSVTSIGNNAFYDCTSLTSVTVGNPIPVSIEQNTFSNRAKATLYVPYGSRNAYLKADYWKEFGRIVEISPAITFADANVKAICIANWDTNDDGELSMEEAASVTDLGSEFQECSNITSFDELQYFTGLTSIGEYAFYVCSGLTSVTIPNSVTSIGNSAFWGCSSLTSVTIPNSVTCIWECAFSDCSGLTSVIIPNSVTIISWSAFSGCSGLTSVTIPNSVTSIVYEAFSGCSGLISISVASDNQVLDSRNDCNAIIETATNTLFVGCKNTVIPNSVSSIGEFAFSCCSGLTSVTIPNSVTCIGNRAFWGCSGLTSVTVESPTPVSISSDVFTNRTNAILYVPAGSKSDYEKANYWRDFKEIIEMGAPSPAITFADNNVKAICVTNWDKDSDGELSVDEAAAVTSLGTVFKKSNISSFNELQYFTGLTEISEGAFAGSTVKEITLPENITTLRKDAFLSCMSLASLHLPAKVKEIGLNALSGCTAMNSITVDEENQHFCDIDGVLFSKDKETLLQFPAAKSSAYTVPEGTTTLARDAFYMSKLESVELPSSLKEIGYDAFGWCRQLTSLVIPEGVTVIGDYILDGCTSLISLHIPAGVSSIGQHICNGCKAITDVWNHSKKPFAINSNNFTSSTYANATLHIPYGLRIVYEETDGWRNFAHIEDDIVAATLSAEDLTINLGHSANLIIGLSNNEKIDGVQFDLTLPAGVSIAKDNHGEYIVETTDRTSKLFAQCVKLGDNLYRIILMSTKRETISNGDKGILRIKLECEQNVTPRAYDLAFTSVSLSRQEGFVSVNEPNDDFTCRLTVYKASTIRGDVNGDYEINITDVLVIVDYILNRPSKIFLFSNADMDKNGEVNITDALNVVNIILDRTESYAPRAARQSAQDLLRMGSDNTGCHISTVAGIPDITAMQMDVVLPADCRLRAATLTGKALGTHQVMMHELENGRYRIVVFSSKKALLDADAAILNLEIEGRGGLVCAEDIQCFDAQNMPILSPDINAVLTGISPIYADSDADAPVYNISGQRVSKKQRGINIVKGSKVVVR